MYICLLYMINKTKLLAYFISQRRRDVDNLIVVVDLLSGVDNYGALGHVLPLDFQQFHFSFTWE